MFLSLSVWAASSDQLVLQGIVAPKLKNYNFLTVKSLDNEVQMDLSNPYSMEVVQFCTIKSCCKVNLKTGEIVENWGHK